MSQFYYSWEDFEKDLFVINGRIHHSGWLPEHIVGVKRGGLVGAVCFSHLFQAPMHVITYQTRENNKSLCFSDLLSIDKDKKILVVDDICDTGETFEKIKEFSKDFKNIKFCSLYYNIRQKINVDYFARKIDRDKDESWIIFPWEKI